MVSFENIVRDATRLRFYHVEGCVCVFFFSELAARSAGKDTAAKNRHFHRNNGRRVCEPPPRRGKRPDGTLLLVVVIIIIKRAHRRRRCRHYETRDSITQLTCTNMPIIPTDGSHIRKKIIKKNGDDPRSRGKDSRRRLE